MPSFPPSVPSISQVSIASKVSGTDAARDDLLEPIPSPPVSSVLEKIEFGRKPLFESDCFLTAAALNPGMMKHGKVVDINHLHVSLAHAHASVLQATARQHDFRLTGQLVSCSACSMAKGNRAPTAHHTTARATRPMELIHIDTAGPFPAVLRGSRYVVMFVDSASRLQRPYGTRDKTAAAIFGVVKRFIADMGFPEHLEVTTEESTQTIRSWRFATTSGSDESGRHRTRLNKMVPGRAHFGEPSRQDTRHVWGLQKFTRISA